MPEYDSATMANLLARVAGAIEHGSNSAKGSTFADLVEYVLAEVPGVTLRHRELLSPDGSAETDLLFRNRPHVCELHYGVTLHVECKNEGRPISAGQVRNFAAKLRDRNQPMGIMVSRIGLSGDPDARNAAHAQVSKELTDGRTIVVATLADLSDLKHTDELVERLIDRRVELETFGAYRSI